MEERQKEKWGEGKKPLRKGGGERRGSAGRRRREGLERERKKERESRERERVRERQGKRKRENLVSSCFEPSQPQRVISGLKERERERWSSRPDITVIADRA